MIINDLGADRLVTKEQLNSLASSNPGGPWHAIHTKPRAKIPRHLLSRLLRFDANRDLIEGDSPAEFYYVLSLPCALDDRNRMIIKDGKLCMANGTQIELHPILKMASISSVKEDEVSIASGIVQAEEEEAEEEDTLVFEPPRLIEDEIEMVTAFKHAKLLLERVKKEKEAVDDANVTLERTADEHDAHVTNILTTSRAEMFASVERLMTRKEEVDRHVEAWRATRLALNKEVNLMKRKLERFLDQE